MEHFVPVGRMVIIYIPLFILFPVLCQRFEDIMIQLYRDLLYFPLREPIDISRTVENIHGRNRLALGNRPKIVEHRLVPFGTKKIIEVGIEKAFPF